LKIWFLVSFIYLILGSSLGYGQGRILLIWKVGSNTPVANGEKVFSTLSQKESFVDSLKNVLINDGFLEVYLAEELVTQDSVKLLINPGRRYFWKKIVSENIPFNIQEKLSPMKGNYGLLSSWMKQVVLEAENQGYPFAQIRLGNIEKEGDSIGTKLIFDAGPLISWDSLELIGNTKTQEKYLQKIVGLQPGTPFSQKELNRTSVQLKRSPYFSLVGEPNVSFQIKTAKPSFQLRDRNSNVLDGIIGLLPNENQPGKMLISGQLDLELYHLGGKGRDISLHWQRLNIQTQSLDLTVKESFLFNSPLDLKVGFNLLKQDTTFLNRFFSLDFGYRISDSGYLSFFGKRQSGDLISTFSYRDNRSLPNAADYRWNQYGIHYKINLLDDLFFPRRGWLIQSEFAAGNKKILKNTGIPDEAYSNLNLNTAQYLGQLIVERHLFIRSNFGIWVKGSGGFMRNENLFLNDLFRLGGLKSIRGFNENFFYARSYVYINIEQRLFFDQSSFLMIFVDGGTLENPYFAKTIDYPVSFGAGLNLETGSGIFRFIYGVGKSNLQPLEFSYSRIHFGYLARF
jgi:outer membrane protein assembly factor BamA